MLRYTAEKAGRALFVIWAAFTVTFVLLFVVPAAPEDLLFDPNEINTVPPDVRAQVAASYGFDKPVIIQYFDRMLSALRGDFGTSVQSGKPVTAAIAEVLPDTLVLSVLALAVALLISFGIVLLAHSTRFRWIGEAAESIPSLAVSTPVFLIGILLLQVFSFQLGLFPSFGEGGPLALVLPTIALAIPVSGPISQLLLRSFSAELDSGYVTTSWAKGARRPQILLGEVFRNASLPALTIAGVTFGNLIAGAVIVETVFSRPGVGRLTQNAINTLDIPVVQGIVVLVAACFALINLAVDLIYPLLDPRLRADPSVSAAPRRGPTLQAA